MSAWACLRFVTYHFSITWPLLEASHRMKLLIVEDQARTGQYLSQGLSEAGFATELATDGETGQFLALTGDHDLLILDVMLPGRDGWQILQAVRQAGLDTPVLFLTARDAVEDRVAGLTAGGDDYVTKPFSLEELVARLRGLMRRAARSAEAANGARLVVGGLTMDEESREVERDGVSIHLTATEFELLRFFMRNPRRVLSKAQILDRVWNYDFGGQANVVELYVSYLRKKIDAGRPPMIHTMRGAGYVLRPAEPSEPSEPGQDAGPRRDPVSTASATGR